MFAALTLSVALAAPVPVQSAPIPAGVAPRVMELKADASGKVMIAVTRMEKVQVGVGAAIAPANGGAVPPAQIMREVPVTRMVELGEVKDLAFTTADGKKVDKDEAMKKLAGGAVVVVTSDGKTVSPTFLKVFKDDTLVLVSPELLVPQGGVGGGVGGFGRPGVRPLPAPVPGVIVKPGVIQVVPIGPGGVQIEVAPEVVPVDKTPKPAPDK
jgi:hypothetical protein